MIHFFYSLINLFKLQKRQLRAFPFIQTAYNDINTVVKTLQTTLKPNFVILASPTLVLYIVKETP